MAAHRTFHKDLFFFFIIIFWVGGGVGGGVAELQPLRRGPGPRPRSSYGLLNPLLCYWIPPPSPLDVAQWGTHLSGGESNCQTSVPESCVYTCSQCFHALIWSSLLVHYEFICPQPCFPDYLVFPSVYKSCDSLPLCPVLNVICV